MWIKYTAVYARVRIWDLILGERKTWSWGGGVQYELRSNRLCVNYLNRPPLAPGAEPGDEAWAMIGGGEVVECWQSR